MNAAASVPEPAEDDGPGLYVHIPFCLSRCGYCTFVSNLYDVGAADRYTDALLREWDRRRSYFADRPPQTLFIGGGTPTALSHGQLRRLLAGLPLPISGEATCEINPDSATPEKLSLLREYGINRCSFGVQTFDDTGLALLQRRHDARTARRAVAAACREGFQAVSVDLIMGWPGQTAERLREDIVQAVDCGIRHLSCYQLIIDADCPAYSSLVTPGNDDDDERELELWETAEDTLSRFGFDHYETSNFALPGFRCRHNVAVWRGGDYAGLGTGAHSYQNGRRFANTDSLERYCAEVDFPEKVEIFSERLEPMARAREGAVFWLRLFDGIDAAVFAERYGIDFWRLYGDTAEELLVKGYLERSIADTGREFIRVPRTMQPVLDTILMELV